VHKKGAKLRRFFVDTVIPTTGVVSITGREARHICSVLRMKRADTLAIMDGKGNLFEASIEKLHSKEVKVRISKSITPALSSPIEISLGLAVIKSHSMDYLIQKVTELGISSITPFYSERTVTKLRRDQLTNKMDRWTEIMKSACKQCGRPILPNLKPPSPFPELTKKTPAKKTLKIILWEDEDKTDLKKVLRSTSPVSHILAIVGPEGGFTQSEINLAREAGFQTISLGSSILRTETAAVSLVAIIQYEWGVLNISYRQEMQKTPY
jgi:16S rRNA (uracil1498-N3)-methyltransferase